MDMLRIDDKELGPGFARALEATRAGPVFIGRCGKPTHVILRLDEYQSLSNASLSLADALRQDEDAEIEFEPGKYALAARVPEL
jgi:hypothetical protein